MTPRFHVYIDEAGDPGVKPKAHNEPHWSDWFVLSAIVVQAERAPETVEWVKEMNTAIRRSVPSSIHYRKLSNANRGHVCRVLSDKPVRIFIVASHKDSMRRHTSAILGKASSGKFYNWCLRILLERVTEWCANRCRKDKIPTQPAKLVFSERGGHDYKELRRYISKIEAQTLTGNLVLDRRGIVPNVIYGRYCDIVPHNNLAGLQLADVAASAFFQAVTTSLPRHTVEPASKLLGRLARRAGQRLPNTFGLMLLPFPHQGEIPVTDRQIFEMGGYRFWGK
jgi:hypothetical protein